MSTSIDDVKLRVKVDGGKAAAADLDRTAASSANLERKADGAAKAQGRIAKSASAVKSSLGQLRAVAKTGGLALATMGIQGVAAGLKYNAVLDSANTSFIAFLGSAQKAEKFTARLSAVSSKSPLPLESYMNSARQLQGFGVAARDVVPYLRSVNKAAVVTGQGGVGMEKIATALGQIKAKGKLTTDSLHQLRAAGVPANKLLRKEFGLTGKQMRNIGSEGIKADRAIKAITGGWEKQFGPAYRNASKTFGSQWEVAKKQLNEFLGEGLEPVISFLEKKVMPVGIRFLTWLNRLPNATKTLILGGAVVAGLAIFSGGLALVVGGIIAVGYVAIKYHRQIGDFVRSIASWISTAAKNVKGFIGALLPVRLVIAALRLQIKILKPVVIGVFKVIWGHVKFLAGIFKVGFSAIKIYIRTAWAVIRRLGAIVGNVVAIVSNLLRGDWRGAWNAAKRLVSNAFGIIKAVARGAMSFIKTIPRQILGLFKGLPGRISDAVSGLFGGIKTAFAGALDWVIDRWNDFLGILRNFKIELPFGMGSFGIPFVPEDVANIGATNLANRRGDLGGGNTARYGPNARSLPKSRTRTRVKSRSLNSYFSAPRQKPPKERTSQTRDLGDFSFSSEEKKSPTSKPRALRIEVPVYLDRRQIALSVVEDINDAAALA